MLDHGIEAVRAHLESLPDASDLPLEKQRAFYDRAEEVFALPAGLSVEHVAAGGVPAELLTPETALPGRIILYLHGGGYVLGSPRSHRHMVAALAARAGAPALVPDYRLAPEHPHPAAVEDALAAYRWLLEEGYPGPGICIAGDSAGGGLAVAALVALRDRGLPLPGAAVCISPWVDLTVSAETYRTKAAADPMVKVDSIRRYVGYYLDGADPELPLASPARADLRGLPPLLIQVGTEEVLLGDAELLAARAEGAGVAVRLEVWDQMIHVWHWFDLYLDEADHALDAIAEFIEQQREGG